MSQHRQNLASKIAGVAAAALALSLTLGSATKAAAQADQQQRVFGMIVSVRGDVYQVQQQYLKGLARVLVDKQTLIMDRRDDSPSALTVGMRAVGYGPKNSAGVVQFRFLHASTVASALDFWGKMVGLKPDTDDGPGWVQLGGTIKSLKPFRVADDAGIVFPASIADLKHFDHWENGSQGQLMIGRHAFIMGDRRASDIIRATRLFLMRSPGQPGTLFGQIEAVGKGSLTILPRFATETLQIAVDPHAVVRRQIAMDPDGIRPGQTVSLWAGHTADSDDLSQITAFVIMPGRGEFPGSARVAEDDSGSTGRTIVGKVLSVSPFVLKAADGKRFTVTVPGQTPTARYDPSSLGQLKAGQQTMLVCSEQSGKLIAKTIVIDASPVIALGL